MDICRRSETLHDESDTSEEAPDEQQCLEDLWSRIKAEPKLDGFTEFFDDKVLLAFIKGKKYDVDRAFETVLNYVNVRIKYGDIFKSIKPSTNGVLPARALLKLRNLDQQERSVVVNRIWKWKPKQVSVLQCIQYTIATFDEYLRNDSHNSKGGLVAVVDCAGFGWEHARAVGPNECYQIIDILWKNVPIRVKEIHIVNEGMFVNTLYKLVRPFLPKKFRDRLQMHSSNLDCFHEHVPREILPEHLGGLLSEEEAFDEDFLHRLSQSDEYYRKFAQKL